MENQKSYRHTHTHTESLTSALLSPPFQRAINEAKITENRIDSIGADDEMEIEN